MSKQFDWRLQTDLADWRLLLSGLLLPLLLVLGGSARVEAAPPNKSTYYRPAGAAPMEEVAGGYRALFTCSAHFVAGRSLPEILDIELRDTQKFDLAAPEIDERRQLVRAVGVDGKVAIAAYRNSTGCTVLPPDWSEADAGHLPYASLPKPPTVANLPFPFGDKARPKSGRAQQALLKRAFDGRSFGEGTITGSVLVVKNGKLIAERYGNGFGVNKGYRTFSTAKSITASLIGIAVRDGLLRVDDPAPIPQWQHGLDPRASITLGNLLNMSSGLVSEGASTNAMYYGGAAIEAAVTSTPLDAVPGERWKYANNDTLLTLLALRHVLADDLRYLRYPYDELFHKIGMYHTRMEMDHEGNFMGSSQVYTTGRDLARFGLLYLNKGKWDGEQILPVGWTDYVATPTQPGPPEKLKIGYGAQFWLFGDLPGVPKGTYTSSGNKGQFSTIVPEKNMVIVRTGVDPAGQRWDHGAFVAEVVKVF